MSKNRDLGNYKEGALSPVQSSLSDTTPGRLMLTGAFGLGGDPDFTLTDLDTYVLPGRYAFGVGAANVPPGFSSGEVEVVYFGGVSPTRLFQTAKQTGGHKLALRYGTYDGTTATFEEWTEIYHQQNILGTVSQSGGVPTGAIIEQGTNGNGRYTKYADGTLFCAQSRFFAGTGSTSMDGIWTPPASFVRVGTSTGDARRHGAESVTCSIGTGAGVYSGNTSTNTIYIEAYNISPITYNDPINAINWNIKFDLALNSDRDILISLIAIGRWY